MEDKKKNNKQEAPRNNSFKEIFCASNGYLSSKRVLGAIVLLVCLGVVVAEAIIEGITDNIKNLLEVLIITSTALLGITSVTSIWKQGKPHHKEETDFS